VRGQYDHVTHVCCRHDDTDDTNLVTVSLDDRAVLVETLKGTWNLLYIWISPGNEIRTYLYSWLLAVIDVRDHDWRFDTLEKRDDTFDFVIEFVIADSLQNYHNGSMPEMKER